MPKTDTAALKKDHGSSMPSPGRKPGSDASDTTSVSSLRMIFLIDIPSHAPYFQRVFYFLFLKQDIFKNKYFYNLSKKCTFMTPL